MPIAAAFQRTVLNRTGVPEARGQEGPTASLASEDALAVVDGKADQALLDAAAAAALAATKLDPADIGVTVQAHDDDLDAIAALSTTAFGRALLELVDAAAARTAIGVPALASGTYTPTLTNVANVTALVAFDLGWSRIGNEVRVRGRLDVQPTTIGASTQIGISLPVATNFSTDYQCGGAGSSVGGATEAVGIFSDATNDRAQMQFIAQVGVSHRIMFSFDYQVI